MPQPLAPAHMQWARVVNASARGAKGRYTGKAVRSRTYEPDTLAGQNSQRRVREQVAVSSLDRYVFDDQRSASSVAAGDA